MKRGDRGVVRQSAKPRATGGGHEGRTERGADAPERLQGTPKRADNRGGGKADKGRATVRRRGTTASGCWKEGRRAEGRKGRRKARAVKGTEGRAEGRGTLGKVCTAWSATGEGRRHRGGGGDKGQGKPGLPGAGGKGQAEVDGGGYMGAPAYPGMGRRGWWGTVISTFPPPL